MPLSLAYHTYPIKNGTGHLLTRVEIKACG